MSGSKFDVHLPLAGPAKVVLDGEDIAGKIRSVTIRAAVGEATVVAVEYYGDVTTVGEGVFVSDGEEE